MTLLLLLLACKQAPAPTPTLWAGQDQRVPMEHPFLDTLELPELSLFASHYTGSPEQRPDVAHRGAYGVGNGRAFALMGLRDPVNTLHSPVGPIYDKEDRFFGDVAMVLEVDGQLQDAEQEWIGQLRGAPITLTRADTQGSSLYTLDMAPILEDDERPPMLIRWLLIDPASGQELRVCLQSYRSPSLEGELPAWVQSSGRAWVLGGAWEQEEETWCLDLGSPEQATQLPIAMVFGDDLTQATLALTQDPEELLDWSEQTLAYWADFQAQGVQIDSPDPRIDDLYQGLRTSVRVQQTQAGGVSPMSRYTGVWLRDTIGPVRFFSRAGMGQYAKEMLDYLYLCHATNGDMSNACSSGLSLDQQLEDPDWASLPPLSGRQKAEGPSYVALAWLAWARDNQGAEQLSERWDYLSRAVLAQEIEGDGLQGWTGDETFRIAMNVAFGLELEVPWQDISYSSNSSLLSAAAAQEMADYAPLVGQDPAPFTQRAQLAHGALEQHFLTEEGHLASALYYDGTLESRPYEDVLLKMLWLSAFDPADPIALAAVESLRDYAQPEPGAFQSPMDPLYQGNTLLGGATAGYATGMTPGYTLFALNALGASDSHDAFNLLPYYADPAGQYSEGVIWDDGSSVQPSYDAGGLLGDFAARYRPWEGGVVGDAMLSYLIGQEGERFRPHLPNGLPWIRYEQVGCLSELALEQDERGLSATVQAASACTIEMQLPLPEWLSELELDGELEYSGALLILPGGERLVAFEAIELEAGERYSFQISTGR